MAVVRAIEQPQIIDEDVLQGIEQVIADARAGKVTEIVCVANDREGACFVSLSDFTDAWRLLGSLDYAKFNVLNAMGRKD